MFLYITADIQITWYLFTFLHVFLKTKKIRVINSSVHYKQKYKHYYIYMNGSGEDEIDN